jgi:predicted ATPase
MHINKLTIHHEKYPDEAVYPFNLKNLRHTGEILFSSNVTFFVGENGSGKSTLIEALARRANIHIWQGFTRSRYKRSKFEDSLYQFISLEWNDGLVPGAFFASEIFRNFSQLLDEWASTDPGVLEYFGGKSLLTQSHGQSHMAFFKNRFKLPGVFLLDEPETALSPKSQLEFLKVLSGANAEAQFIIATHSPILLSLERARILSFDHTPLTELAYRHTSHFETYRSFFEQLGKK